MRKTNDTGGIGMEKHLPNLTSAEIASLWTAYVNDSMATCILAYMLTHIEDKDIHVLVKEALTMSSEHISSLQKLFHQEKFAIPNGFGKQDVNVNAPRLYTDTFCLSYLNHMSKAGMIGYSGSLAMSARYDLIDYFSTALHKTASLYEKTTKLALEKGILTRPPYICMPSEVDYIDSKKYISGFHLFSKNRPVNAVEISHLFLNIQTNLIGYKICLSFAQTATSKEVKQFMMRGNEISKKHIKLFADTLLNDHIPAPMSPDLCITNSTTPVFSEKLMMFHMSLLSATGTGNYATAAAASQRSDLAFNYERMSLEIGRYAKAGVDIMIKNHWLEQPPGTINKEQLILSTNKKHE